MILGADFDRKLVFAFDATFPFWHMSNVCGTDADLHRASVDLSLACTFRKGNAKVLRTFIIESLLPFCFLLFSGGFVASREVAN